MNPSALFTHRLYGVFIGIACLAAPLLAEPEHEFQFSFNHLEPGSMPPNILIGETNGSGELAYWQVVEMEDAPSGARAFGVTESRNLGEIFNLAFVQHSYFLNVELSVKIKALSGVESQGGGILCRSHDPQNYYVAYWNPLEKEFRIDAMVDGVRKRIASAAVDADTSKWHEIEIEVEDNEIEATFDDEVELEVEDTHLALAGMVGLWTQADAATLFDDLEIELEDR